MWLWLLLSSLPTLAAEDKLLRRANRGDQEAVIEIYDRYFQSIYRFVRNRVDDPQQAEDITSEVFLKLVQSLGGTSAPQKSLRGWLFQVARHEISRYVSQQRQATHQPLEEWLPDDAQIDPEVLTAKLLEREQLQKLLKRLVPDQQEVLLLRFTEMLNLEETAEAMNKSVSAVKSLQFRAIKNLQQLLAMSEEEGHA
ncbi:MAG: hypothetical protein CUN55_07260 [Phototrophicales bacterium]|nr:MAG: hypothetical protein CUN55_07260 [Phototrophicales bacterium]